MFGQGLGQLLVADVAEILGQLAQQFAGALLLLIEQLFQLLVGDEAQVDENLTDPPQCHVWFRLESNALEEMCREMPLPLNAAAE